MASKTHQAQEQAFKEGMRHLLTFVDILSLAFLSWFGLGLLIQVLQIGIFLFAPPLLHAVKFANLYTKAGSCSCCSKTTPSQVVIARP